MIPKAKILALAKAQQLRPTTVEKDYVIGWLLQAISEHPVLSRWVFKGGTCLRKCFFETYRLSEDLDFTIPTSEAVSVESITQGLGELGEWIEQRCGLGFPRSDLKVEQYTNRRGNPSFQAKVAFAGPLRIAPKSLQRVKFDLTQDELLVASPALRDVHHGYDDAAEPPPQVLCYSINEVLGEKTRALVERQGRARDVYDIVNISRNFREEIDAQTVREVATKKFEFKGLPPPAVDGIVGAIDEGLLEANWEHQLAHQLPVLAPVEAFVEDIRDAISWWLEPESARPPLAPNPNATGPVVAAPRFPTSASPAQASPLEQIRYAARNRLCALVTYRGAQRLVEPYSLRHPSTGNRILHVWEVEKNGRPSRSHKSFITSRITAAAISNRPFRPRWAVEL
ncbi:MAG: hypothetical protein DRI90_15650 [Deltaproteobacteria bacterium]|nr:MAG: hypothetical protein DRI90_15650 [Deltaproteobacteria bacterium]